MKRLKTLSGLGFFVVLFVSSSICLGQESKVNDKPLPDSLPRYKDGLFTGSSRAAYTDEPFWGIACLSISKGLIDSIGFIIRDSSLHETFDGNYEKHFIGNPIYIFQSRSDWSGVQKYTRLLSETHEIDKVDVISGATWSYNIFKASVNEALKKAEHLPDSTVSQ
jgi:uncharacterized protein with FMN-binding domain